LQGENKKWPEAVCASGQSVCRCCAAQYPKEKQLHVPSGRSNYFRVYSTFFILQKKIRH
jgi:hypothetical protein